MADYPTLSTTPIKETIFTISYSETIETDALKRFCQSREIAERFDSVRDGFSTQLITAEDKKPSADVHTDGYILKSSKENKIIQAREGAFSFHKVKEYEKFDVLLSELLYLWGVLVSCCEKKLTINNISLRYLNFIDYDQEKISDLIKIIPVNPFTENLNQSFMHLNFRDNKYETVDVNIFTAYPVERESQKCVILDTILNKDQDEVDDYQQIKDDFLIMRGIKNHVFFTSITNYTLSKYL